MNDRIGDALGSVREANASHANHLLDGLGGFIMAQGDQTLGPRLLARGAVACLFKPFSETALLEALSAALEGRQRGTTVRDTPAWH